MITARRLDIPEVQVLTCRIHGDARGFFSETFNRREFAKALELPESSIDFVQDNQSFSRAAGTVRGLHYQSPPSAQGKLIRVLRGKIFDVAVDFRRGSPTFLKWVGIELSENSGEQLWIPDGFLHGFMTLVPDVMVAYKVTNYYDPKRDGSVLWSDPAIGIRWPDVASNYELSEKDAMAARASELETPFTYASVDASH